MIMIKHCNVETFLSNTCFIVHPWFTTAILMLVFCGQMSQLPGAVVREGLCKDVGFLHCAEWRPLLFRLPSLHRRAQLRLGPVGGGGGARGGRMEKDVGTPRAKEGDWRLLDGGVVPH